jgi:hypothetical protein
VKHDLTQLAYVHGWGAVYKALMEMKPKDVELPLPLPESPEERPCHKCRRWIKVGERMTFFRWGPHGGKQFHEECAPK